jgi:putative copper resistance protein D
MDDTAPGLAEALTHFTFDVPWSLAILVAGGWYLLAWRRARNRGSAHPVGRLVAFLAGLAALVPAVLGPLEYYGNQVLWLNFTVFLVITMIAAPLLLLGAPVTLAFRISGKAGRKRLRGVIRSRAFAIATFPVLTWLAFAVVTYVWQFTGLFETAAKHTAVRELQLATLLLVSLAFWAPALCADPLRWRMAYPLRALYVFVEMTHKGLFGGMFLSMTSPFHDEFAANLPAWAPSPMDDQRLGILVLWVGGNLIFMVALVGLVARWLQYERRNAHRTDWRLRLRRQAEARRKAAIEQVFRRSP